MRRKWSHAIGRQEIVGDHKPAQNEYALVADVKAIFKNKVEKAFSTFCCVGYNLQVQPELLLL
jgi:hypothetical protein